MKNVLVPAAIAIGGLLVVNQLKNADTATNLHPTNSKQVHAKHHRDVRNSEVAVTASEVQANTIKVTHFAPLTEIVASTFLIDFNDEQTQIADQEIINQMEESLVEISLPETKEADEEMMKNFTAKY